MKWNTTNVTFGTETYSALSGLGLKFLFCYQGRRARFARACPWLLYCAPLALRLIGGSIGPNNTTERPRHLLRPLKVTEHPHEMTAAESRERKPKGKNFQGRVKSLYL